MYGETGAAMRAEFAALLRQHRIQQRLVGTTAEEREELGGLIRTYRQSVIVWLSQAMRAASPLASSNMPPAQPNPFRSVGSPGSHLTAASELARAIDIARQQSSARASSLAAVTWEPLEPTARNGFGCAGDMLENASGLAARIAWPSQTSTVCR